MAHAQVNTYRGSNFGTLFVDYEKVSGKPLLFGEYGIDAYDSVGLREDQDVSPSHHPLCPRPTRPNAPLGAVLPVRGFSAG